MSRRMSLLVSLVLTALFAWNVPIRGVRIWVDPVSGSTKRDEWVLIFPWTTTISHSDLERWIIHREGSYFPRWKHLFANSFGVAGQVLYRSCSLAPVNYMLCHGETNAEFVRNASDKQIAEFVRVMRTGRKDEKLQAVEQALRRTRPNH